MGRDGSQTLTHQLTRLGAVLGAVDAERLDLQRECRIGKVLGICHEGLCSGA